MSNIEQEEHYELNWKGKRNAISEAFTTSKSIMEECKQDSQNWDTTNNLYIEGDSIDALKLLQDQYENKIKMIYIDPPYNTKTRKIYNDNFHTNLNGSVDKHSKWLNMMYPRLMLAKKLLRDDGVIFISIDDHEVHNLRKICDEIFGEENFLSSIVWERAFAPISLKKHFSVSHDYVACYSKNIDDVYCNGLPRTKEANDRYSNPDNDSRGFWMSGDMTVGPAIAEKCYEITLPSGRTLKPTDGRCWLYTHEKYMQMLTDNRIWFGLDGNNTPRVKKFLTEVKQCITPMTIWKHGEVGHSQDASQRLKELFAYCNYFDYPKPVGLIKRGLELYSNPNDLILDFFSGSATTAHAVMQLNAEDGGNRKFIMVQLPEPCPNGSEALKAGYKTIADIGKERIRRAGKKIIKELEEKNRQTELGVDQTCTRKLDIGFRVYKIKSI